MKSFEQIARAMHAAFVGSAEQHEPHMRELFTWGDLDEVERQCWIAAARQAAQELAQVH